MPHLGFIPLLLTLHLDDSKPHRQLTWGASAFTSGWSSKLDVLFCPSGLAICQDKNTFFFEKAFI